MPDNVWYIDSGCSRHMTGNSALFHDFKNVNGGYVAFGSKGGRISGQGTVSNGTLSLKQVNFVDILDYNLLSVPFETVPCPEIRPPLLPKATYPPFTFLKS